VDANEILPAGLRLAMPASDGDTAQARRMVALLVDGLRYRASAPAKTVRKKGSGAELAVSSRVPRRFLRCITPSLAEALAAAQRLDLRDLSEYEISWLKGLSVRTARDRRLLCRATG
jgi:hypothetical protein